MVSFYQFNVYLETGRWEQPVQQEGVLSRVIAPVAIGFGSLLPAPQADAQQPAAQTSRTNPQVQNKTFEITVPWRDSNDTPFFVPKAQKAILYHVRSLGARAIVAIEDNDQNMLYANGRWNMRGIRQLITRAKGGVVNIQVTIHYVP